MTFNSNIIRSGQQRAVLEFGFISCVKEVYHDRIFWKIAFDIFVVGNVSSWTTPYLKQTSVKESCYSWVNRRIPRGTTTSKETNLFQKERVVVLAISKFQDGGISRRKWSLSGFFTKMKCVEYFSALHQNKIPLFSHFYCQMSQAATFHNSL